MEIKITYSQMQLECAIDYISQNNQNFLGQEEEIKNTIMEYMTKIAKDPDATFVSIMGFILVADREFESLDNDENICNVEIYVDPSMGIIDEIDDLDGQSQIIDTDVESIWK